MHLEHEAVEMDAALLRDRRGREEQVHQHRLAAPDRAEDIETRGRRLGRAGKPEPGAPAALDGSRPVVGEGAREALQLLHRKFLPRVAHQLAGPAPRAVAAERPIGGGRAGGGNIGLA